MRKKEIHDKELKELFRQFDVNLKYYKYVHKPYLRKVPLSMDVRTMSHIRKMDKDFTVLKNKIFAHLAKIQ